MLNALKFLPKVSKEIFFCYTFQFRSVIVVWLKMFWYLVRYTCDGIFQVVSKVLKRKSSLKARYYDGHYYDIEIIAKHSSCETLKEICQNIEAHLPIVILTQKELQKGIISHITKESGE